MKKPEDFLMQHIKERCYYPDSNINMVDEKGALAALKAMQSDHDAESAKHHDLLIEILEYMEAREDADIEGENKEMRFAMGLREMLKID